MKAHILNAHLQKARNALERQGRSGSRQGPTPEDVLKAVQEMLAYLEEHDGKATIMVNEQPVR